MLPTVLEKMNKRPWLQQRYVFTFVGFLTTFVVAILNFHLELIIYDMVENNRTDGDRHDLDSCPNLVTNSTGTVSLAHVSKAGNATISSRYAWDRDTVTALLGSYYAGYVWTQWVGGFAAELIGGKPVMAFCVFTAGILTILAPVTVVFTGSEGLRILRFILGLALGPTIPVLLCMMSKWIPKKEHTFIASLIFPGAFIGQVAANYITDVTVTAVGWKSVCYMYGIFGVILGVLWKLFAYSTPNMHPHISEKEKKYLNENVISLIRTTKYELDPLPWKAYLYSAPLWSVTIGYIGKEWAYMVLMYEIPEFMKEVFNVDIADSVHLSSAPLFCIWVSSMVFGYLCDFIVNRGGLDCKKARQLFTSFGLIGGGLCAIIAVYSNCSPIQSYVWMCVGMVALGATFGGVFISTLDLTPNYAGNAMGIVDNLGISVAWAGLNLKYYLVPGALLSEWKLFFWLMLIVILVTLAVYLYYVEVDQLWWDDVRSHGYPDKWKGLFTTNARIDTDLKNVFVPPKDVTKAL